MFALREEEQAFQKPLGVSSHIPVGIGTSRFGVEVEHEERGVLGQLIEAEWCGTDRKGRVRASKP